VKPEPLFASVTQFASATRCILLCLDFDGTLAPIRDRPEECELDPAVARTLTALAACNRIKLAIVSGRELNDLRGRVGIAGITYAGNHGLEIEGPDFAFREPTAVNLSGVLDKLTLKLALAVASFPGAWVQSKGLSTSVHYRQSQTDSAPRIIEIVRQVSASAIAAHQVVLRKGKKVVEVRPSVNWDKGKAVRWIANRAATSNPPLLIYCGDDDTDEDAFIECRDGITVLVGENPHSAAQYFVRTPADVHAFLELLLAAFC